MIRMALHLFGYDLRATFKASIPIVRVTE